MEGAIVNTSTRLSKNGSIEGCVPSTEVMVTILTIFGVILLVGILGNILVIVIIASVKTMRSTVNKCLLTLAFADLVILIILPFRPIIEEMTDSTVPIGAEFCKFCNLYDKAARISSVLIYYYVTIDRYFALCHPLMPRRFRTTNKMYVTLLAFWIISFVMSIPFLISTQYIIEAGDNVTHYYCYFGEDAWMVGYDTFIIIFVFFIPIPIILVLYGRMIHKLRESIETSDNKVTSDEVRGRRGRGQVVFMMLILMVIFVLSQLPFMTIILFYYYLPGVLQINPYDKFTFIITWVFRILIYVNSASNPVIYFALSTNFRRSFLELFGCRANQKNTSQLSLAMTTNSHLRFQ